MTGSCIADTSRPTPPTEGTANLSTAHDVSLDYATSCSSEHKGRAPRARGDCFSVSAYTHPSSSMMAGCVAEDRSRAEQRRVSPLRTVDGSIGGRRCVLRWRFATSLGGAIAVLIVMGLSTESRMLTFAPVAVAVLAGLAVYVAIEDATTTRISNDLMLLAAGSVAAGMIGAILIDGHRGGTVVGGVAFAWLFSGAPVGFGLWWLRPDLLGGGDWKLLSVLGAGLGLWAPLAVPLILIVALPIQVVQSLVRRRRELPFGPALVAGFISAIVAAALFPETLGGPLT